MAEGDKPKGYLAKYGARLLANGYEIIPIKRGTKRPHGDDWQKIRATPKLLQAWVGEGGPYQRAGVGILTRKTVGVDIDILDETAALHMEDFVRDLLGDAPLRIGMAPKRLLVYRVDHQFTKINSKTFDDPFGDPEAVMSGSGKPVGHKRKVEILGDGEQFVAYAMHPDTGRPYEWIGDGLTKVKWEDLPVITEEDGQAIVAEFERYAVEVAAWDVAKSGQALARPSGRSAAGKVDPDDVFASDTEKVNDVDEVEIRRLLLLVQGCEDYDTWLQIGMALYHQFDGEAYGLELWHEWSQEADNYDSDALDAKWDTFDAEGKGRAPVTARLILKLAREYETLVAVETFKEIRDLIKQASDAEGLKAVCERVKKIEFDVMQRVQIVGMVQKKFKELTDTLMSIGVARQMTAFEKPRSAQTPHWLQGWVYVAHSNGFYSMKHRFALGTDAFNAVNGRHMLTPSDVLEGKAVPETPASYFALNNEQIPLVQNMMYLPGEDDLFTYNGLQYVNTYQNAQVPEPPKKLGDDERDAIATVEGHVAHLFANERDRRILIDAIAYLVQNPGRRINWGIMLQGVEGDGKTFFSGLMAAVLGPQNVKNLQAQNLEEKFNGWAEGAQVVFFEEIKLHGHNRYDVLNKVKPLLTNVMVTVRKMQTDVYEVVNTVTYFLTTNFRDALPLDTNDSRYFILFSRWQTKAALDEFKAADPTYYARLYGALEHGGALRKWLLKWKIGPDFDANARAPSSSGRTEMISYARTEEMDTLSDILDTSPRLDMTRTLLNATDLADEIGKEEIVVPQTKTINKLLLDAGFTKLGRFRPPGENLYKMYWSQTPERFARKGAFSKTLIYDYLADDL